MPLQNRVDPFGNLFAAPARGTLFGNRGGKFHRDDKTLGQRALGLAAMDLLRARVQEPPARRLGPLLHRAVLSRRGDGVRRRPPAVLRMPAQGRGGLRRAVLRQDEARAAPAMDEVLHAERLDGKAKRVHRRKLDTLPDGAMIARAGEVLAVRGKASAALDAVRLWVAGCAPARWRRGRSDAAIDPGGSGCRLSRRSGIRARRISPSSPP